MVVFAELKTQRGKTTASQEQWLTALRACGQMAFIWRPSEMSAICQMLVTNE
jgi:hypothetical protein